MGLGYWTCEDIVYDGTTGEVLTDRSWNYHVPLAKDIPVDFNIYFKRNSFNENGVLGSKGMFTSLFILHKVVDKNDICDFFIVFQLDSLV